MPAKTVRAARLGLLLYLVLVVVAIVLKLLRVPVVARLGWGWVLTPLWLPWVLAVATGGYLVLTATLSRRRV